MDLASLPPDPLPLSDAALQSIVDTALQLLRSGLAHAPGQPT